MLKFLTKQLLYGRLYLWLKERIGGILFLFIAIFLVIYFHNEYLNYVEYKNKFDIHQDGLNFTKSYFFSVQDTRNKFAYRTVYSHV